MGGGGAKTNDFFLLDECIFFSFSRDTYGDILGNKIAIAIISAFIFVDSPSSGLHTFRIYSKHFVYFEECKPDEGLKITKINTRSIQSYTMEYFTQYMKTFFCCQVYTFCWNRNIFIAAPP